MLKTVAERIETMDAITARGVMEVAGLQWIKAGSERLRAVETMKQAGILDTIRFNALTARYKLLERLHSKIFDRVFDTEVTFLDRQSNVARESFFR